MKITKEIKKRRRALKITQPQLADLAGISVNTLYKIERGQGNPTLETLIKIADALGMELSMQLQNNDPMQF